MMDGSPPGAMSPATLPPNMTVHETPDGPIYKIAPPDAVPAASVAYDPATHALSVVPRAAQQPASTIAWIERTYLPAPPPPGIRRLPRRIVALPLPAPYDDFHIRCWANFPQTYVADAQKHFEGILPAEEEGIEPEERARRVEAYAETERRVARQMSEVLIAHDLCDDDGIPLPPSDDPKFWLFLMGHELRDVIFTEIRGQYGKLTPTKGTR